MTENPDNPTPEVDSTAGESPDIEVEIGLEEASSDASEATSPPAMSSPEIAVADAPTNGGISPELLFDPYGEEVLDVSAEAFEALLSERADVMGDFREGEIVNAKVLRVTDSMVILEFGFKSEGAVPLDEFKDRTGMSRG